MKQTFERLARPIDGELRVPGDKSISHRAIMLGSLAKGKTTIESFLEGEDCLHTIEIFRAFGVDIEQNGTDVVIQSNGVASFKEPKIPLYFGNSGTTARLMLGLLAALPFHTVAYGDPHLTKRPMDRVAVPLRKMEAKIDGRNEGSQLPIAVRGNQLFGMTYELPVKSAQVKSALLLAGLFAKGETTIIEKAKTRDHTENMLRAFGAEIKTDGMAITVRPAEELVGGHVVVPGDISSAAFFLTAAAIVPESHLVLKDVGLNKTRTGIIDVLEQMGANLFISNEREVSGEWLGDITIQAGPLQATTIDGDMIPRLIDEIPVIALLATQAEGKTVIRDAAELRVKETDRIKAVIDVLTTLGARIEELDDGMVIHGKTPLGGGEIKSYYDHRIAMMGVIASTIAEAPVTLDDTQAINISYPAFLEDLEKLA